jgi:hypothetical protein
MMSRTLLILAALAVGLWLRGGTDVIAGAGLPVLALLALVLAIVAAPPARASDARARLEDLYRAWLDAAQRVRTAPHQPEAAAALHAASHGILVLAGDRVVRAVQEATRSGLTPETLAAAVIEMRRSTGRPSVTLRADELATFLDSAGAGTTGVAADRQPDSWPAPASWLR